jgi:hypothetical protein
MGAEAPGLTVISSACDFVDGASWHEVQAAVFGPRYVGALGLSVEVAVVHAVAVAAVHVKVTDCVGWSVGAICGSPYVPGRWQC